MSNRAAMSRKDPTLNLTPSNVRHLEAVGWQVMLEDSLQWHTCSNERDARFIASGMRLADSVARGETSGREVAEELDAVAIIAEKNLGHDGAVQILTAAELARRKS
jgi:hypothetical protein